MHLLILRPEAVADLDEGYHWYESQLEGLGEEFMRAVEARLSAIAQQPETFHSVTATTRRAMVRRFPYGVFFRVEPDAVIVTAIMHASRNPGLWRKRS
jgi:plasmid stabilization system protein ParE